ncbi:MAG TPA: FAD-dependent oxidoreductase [Acidimicrobiales bacterium]|nr:FAD-dependent oxidoreductase [Acidimicrobiales bacterium]
MRGGIMRTVIVGGVAGGMSTAARLRRLDEAHEIVVLERSQYVSYANCGLPYYVGGTIEDREALILGTPQSFASRFGIDVRTGTEALAVDRERSVVVAREVGSRATYEIPWDHLVLSPGATAFVPDVPGVGRALTLRTIEDMDKVRSATRDGHASSAVVVGGGFIGLEAAENLQRAGLSVTVVELAAQVLAPLDPELAQLVADELAYNGVGLALGAALAKVLPDAVELTNGQVLPADLVLLAIGVQPDTALARAAGLALGPRGGIQVDEHLRTSDPRIYAVGDAVEKLDQLSAEPVLVPLANIANHQGRRVADEIAGVPRPFRPVQSTAIIRVFGLTAAVTGWNEKRLAAAGHPYIALHTHPGSHAGYYPGASPMALKLLIEPTTGAILGAEAVGADGVDKRMDVLATAMHAGLTGPQLAELELAYAPQFSSAKDPVNMLGYVCENRLNDNESSVQWYEVPGLAEAGAVIIDLRTPQEHADGHIPGSWNLPLDELRARRPDLSARVPNGSRVVVYCAAGQRAHIGYRLLASWGYDVVNLDGGYLTWSAGTRAEYAAREAAQSAGSAKPT